jgi:hypothetical protein
MKNNASDGCPNVLDFQELIPDTEILDEQLNAGVYTPAEYEVIKEGIQEENEHFSPKVDLGMDLHDVVSRKDRLMNLAYIQNYHLGQRKLFLTELMMLCTVLGSFRDKANILYAGAADGSHIRYLASLFPNTKWYLYDPAPFHKSLNGHKRIRYFNEYFTDEVARSYAGKIDIFISDIRLIPEASLKIKKEMEKTKDQALRRKMHDERMAIVESQTTVDMEHQQRWLDIIEPSICGWLKWHTHFVDKSTIMKYHPAELFFQPWAPPMSHEFRALVRPKDYHRLLEYDVFTVQHVQHYHNMLRRPWFTYKPPPMLTGILKRIDGYDKCYDCTFEAGIWLKYFELFGMEEGGMEEVEGSIVAMMNGLGANIVSGAVRGLLPNLNSKNKGEYNGHGHGRFYPIPQRYKKCKVLRNALANYAGRTRDR